MTATPYIERAITLTLRLGKGSFGGSGFNTITLAGLRCAVQIQTTLTPMPGLAVVRVWGLTLSQINELTKAGLLFVERENNVILIEAGDAKSGMTAVFEGSIYQAYPEANQPDMPLVILANPAYNHQLKPVKPTSYKGDIDGVTVLSQIVKSLGLTLESNGVSAMLSNPYFAGTAWEQIKALINAMGCYGYLDSPKKTLAIWKKGAARAGRVPIVSPSTGMIGYPEFQQNQVRLKTLFDPTSLLSGGMEIEVQSELKAANGKWSVTTVTTNIAAQMPDGPWEMLVTASPLDAKGQQNAG